MGFRNLSVFNQALLAKQGWRIIQNPSSLVSRVLKGRYFPHSSFLDAYRGHNPSLSWRSIWGAGALLCEGLRWRVGNGVHINVWRDKWFKPLNTTKPSASMKLLYQNLTVDSLICHESRSWQEDTIRSTFDDEETCIAILSIPLSIHRSVDAVYWTHTKDGIFSVRTAYWLGMNGPLDNLTATHDELWQRIWSMNTIPKLKHWLWRICNEFVGVFHRLYQRRIRNSDQCPRCNTSSETIIHALLLCPESALAIDASSYATLINEAPKHATTAFFRWIFEKMDGVELIELLGLLWALWTHRNNVVFNNEPVSLTNLIQGFNVMLRQFEELSSSGYTRSSNCTIASADCWVPPPNGWVKINVDAAVLGDHGTGLGWAVRDANGRLLAAGSKRLGAQWNAQTSEFAAARWGIQKIDWLGYREVILESDALNVISAIHNSKEFKNDLHHFLSDIMSLVAKFNLFSVSHVKRGGNCLAHYLARLSSPNEPELMYFHNFPQGIQALADFDLMK